MNTLIHVNQHEVLRFLRHGTAGPCITVKRGKLNRYCHEAQVLSREGVAIVRVCSAVPTRAPDPRGLCWIEATGPLVLYRGGVAAVALAAGRAVIRVSRQQIRGNGAAKGPPVLAVFWVSRGAPEGAAARGEPADEVLCRDAHGRELAKVLYRPAKPLPCGARCWVETEATVRLCDAFGIETEGAAPPRTERRAG